jgi:hypothetical protein
MHDTEPFAVINRSWLCHRLAVFATSTGSLEPPLAHLFLSSESWLILNLSEPACLQITRKVGSYMPIQSGTAGVEDHHVHCSCPFLSAIVVVDDERSAARGM